MAKSTNQGSAKPLAPDQLKCNILKARVDEERKKAPLTVNMETGNASSKHFDGEASGMDSKPCVNNSTDATNKDISTNVATYVAVGGDKLTLAVPESERMSAASPGVDPNMASPQSTSLSLASSEQSSSDSPTIPVTITHFQQSDAGTLEKKTVPECNNPFLFAPASPALRAASSKNPFATDPTHSNNPFLLRLASPRLGNRVTPIASEIASSVEKPVTPCPSTSDTVSSDGSQQAAPITRPPLSSNSPTQLSPWHVPESSVPKSTSLVMKRTVVTEL